MPSYRFSHRLPFAALIFGLSLTGCGAPRVANLATAAPPVIVNPTNLERAQASAAAAPPVVVNPTNLQPAQPTAAANTSLSLTLAQCLQMAYERQPRVSTARASLAAAEDADRALCNLRLPAKLDPQVPIRRQQSALGIRAAAAGVDKAERETAYAVVRNYYTVLYAREQEKLAKGVVTNLSTTKKNAELALKDGARDISANDINRAAVYLGLAETKRIEATQGVKRALIALREAIGLGADVMLDVPESELPKLDARPERDLIVGTAQTRRGELIQATLFAQIACLEVAAQSTSHLQKFQTFAAGSDIHSTQVPQGSNDADYRPGAAPPEMPSLLVGTRPERMTHAETLKLRALAMVQTTRNLITLEAEDALLRWQQASEQAEKAKEAADAGEKYANDLKKSSAGNLKVKVEDLVSSRVLASQAQSEYNQYLYKQIVALADLERITAGGFNAGLVEPQPAPKK